MTELVVRRPPFAIDQTVPFQWQPANPVFGLFGNAFTFIAIAFERYVVSVTRQAMERITDPAAHAEADAFLRQEAQHARAHTHHAKAMIARYPALAEVQVKMNAAYDELLATESLEFHTAYVADLEATFTPLFKMVLDNRGPLFEGGDERIGTLLLWHFVEEVEHRSSGLIVHQAVCDDRWYRVKQTRRVFAHVHAQFGSILAAFDEHVPFEERGAHGREVVGWAVWVNELSNRFRVLARWRPGTPPMLGRVPGKDLAKMAGRLALSQLPHHDPANEPLPAWAAEWHAAFDRGDDVTTYAGVHL